MTGDHKKSVEESGTGETISCDTAKESEKLVCDLCDETLKLTSCIDASETKDSKEGTASKGIARNATDPGAPADTGAY